MYSLIALIHGPGEGLSAALAQTGAISAPVIEGSFNGGDLSAIWNFGNEADYRAAQTAINAALTKCARADTAFFAHGKTGIASPGLSTGVHRTLLLCADQRAIAERLRQFAAELVLMPKHIPAIRNWRLSSVIEATGDLPWTHVWEQEYEDVGGLMGPYMLHPYHWAFIDRWFDHECPDWLVNLKLCHSFAAYGKAVLS